jgi:hypothetical protein
VSTTSSGADVLVSGPHLDPPRPWVRTAGLLAAAAALVAATAVTTARAVGHPTRTAVTGELTLEVQALSWHEATRSASPGPSAAGPVEVAGAVSSVPTARGSVLQRSGGAAVVHLDRVSCHGSFGWSYYYRPGWAGGSLALQCDDGSVVGGRVAAGSFLPPGLTSGHWKVTARLVDAYYVAAS